MRRLTMSRERRRDASTPEAAKSDHMSHPSMKVSTGPRRKIIPVKWFHLAG